MTLTALLFRTVVKKLDKKRDKGLSTPDNIMRYDAITYGNAKLNQVLDVYKPMEQAKEILPVIINIHGGGWVYGDKELYQFYCMSLAQHGFAIINFTYRLAPKHHFPAQMEDLNHVIHWMFDNHKTYGFDLNHVFFVGDSAGANLASLYGCICTNKAYRNRFETFHIPKGFKPKAMALNCGIYKFDHLILQNKMLPSLAKDLLGKGSKRKHEWISPYLHLSKGFPPCFLASGNKDFVREQTQFMKQQLDMKGLKYVYKIYGDSRHHLYHIFQCNINKPEAKRCNQDQCDFFKSTIH